MRFEEWKKTQDDQFLCARHVWEAAQKIEREACLAGVRGVMVTDNSRRTWKRCIEAIEKRSNVQYTP